MQQVLCPCNYKEGASHANIHRIGLLGVGHGETMCLLLPAMCKNNACANSAQKQRMLDFLWSKPLVSRVVGRKDVDQTLFSRLRWMRYSEHGTWQELEVKLVWA